MPPRPRLGLDTFRAFPCATGEGMVPRGSTHPGSPLLRLEHTAAPSEAGRTAASNFFTVDAA